MAKKSNEQGRAYEYSCLISFYNSIKSIRAVHIKEDRHFEVCRLAWDRLSEETKEIFLVSSQAAVRQIMELEPMMESTLPDDLELCIQPDSAGENGDVRDILIIRDAVSWEIGISVKHNHFAVKHSRLSKDIDFGEVWLGDKCSRQYWDDSMPVFNYLSECKESGLLFDELPDKRKNVYLPLLNAFIKELTRLFDNKKNIAKLVEYLLGKYDFYKVISVDDQKFTSVRAVNVNGTLNKSSLQRSSKFYVPTAKLPARLIYIGLKPQSDTTVELYLDNGWQFTFRIHNAERKVVPSLKFDIQIVGMPTAMITFNCAWK